MRDQATVLDAEPPVLRSNQHRPAPSFITTVQVIPALMNTPGGTCVRWIPTGMRCASRTHVNVGLIEERSSGPSLLS
jgi:hypothetical protein